MWVCNQWNIYADACWFAVFLAVTGCVVVVVIIIAFCFWFTFAFFLLSWQIPWIHLQISNFSCDFPRAAQKSKENQTKMPDIVCVSLVSFPSLLCLPRLIFLSSLYFCLSLSPLAFNRFHSIPPTLRTYFILFQIFPFASLHIRLSVNNTNAFRFQFVIALREISIYVNVLLQ